MSRLLSDWLDSYIDFVDMTEPPNLFKQWCAVSTIAACLKRKCWLDWDTQTYPNMYIVLIGPSGARKGTAMYPALSFLRELGIKMAAESLTREALIGVLAESTETYLSDPEDPTGLIKHSSITIFSPELAVFLGYNQPTLISALTDWWDCRDPWTYHTVGGGEKRIDATWVNLIGATTPDLLQTTLPQDAIGGGLTSRMIFVYGSQKSKRVALPFKYTMTPESLKLRTDLMKDLEIISQLQGAFEPDKEYLNLYESWYANHENIPLKKELNYEPYLTRRSTHLRKLTMIMSASRSDEMILTKLDFVRSLSLLEATEKEMPNVFRGYGKSVFAEIYPRIIAYLVESKGCYYGDLLKTFHRDISDEDLKKVLRTLEQMEPARVTLTTKKVGTKMVQGKETNIVKTWIVMVE